MKDPTHKLASATLGVTKPGKWYTNRDTWLWNDDAEMKVREKKRLYHKFFDDKTPADWQIYKNANREAKKAVAVTRAEHYKNLYDKLDIWDGERDLYRLVKRRNERTQDIEYFCCVNDEKGTLLTNRRAATDRWREYFEQISTEEFAHPPLPQSLPTFGSVPPASAAGSWCSEVAARKVGRQPYRPNQNQVPRRTSIGTGRCCNHFGLPAVIQ